jgi:hypothetical protein
MNSKNISVISRSPPVSDHASNNLSRLLNTVKEPEDGASGIGGVATLVSPAVESARFYHLV